MGNDAVSPKHYQFSNGVQINAISGELNSNGGQALQYIARSTRLDSSRNKGETVAEWVEDLEKARQFIDFELARLAAESEVRHAAVADYYSDENVNRRLNEVNYLSDIQVGDYDALALAHLRRYDPVGGRP